MQGPPPPLPISLILFNPDYLFASYRSCIFVLNHIANAFDTLLANVPHKDLLTFTVLRNLAQIIAENDVFQSLHPPILGKLILSTNNLRNQGMLKYVHLVTIPPYESLAKYFSIHATTPEEILYDAIAKKWVKAPLIQRVILLEPPFANSEIKDDLNTLFDSKEFRPENTFVVQNEYKDLKVHLFPANIYTTESPNHETQLTVPQWETINNIVAHYVQTFPRMEAKQMLSQMQTFPTRNASPQAQDENKRTVAELISKIRLCAQQCLPLQLCLTPFCYFPIYQTFLALFPERMQHQTTFVTNFLPHGTQFNFLKEEFSWYDDDEKVLLNALNTNRIHFMIVSTEIAFDQNTDRDYDFLKTYMGNREDLKSLRITGLLFYHLQVFPSNVSFQVRDQKVEFQHRPLSVLVALGWRNQVIQRRSSIRHILGFLMWHYLLHNERYWSGAPILQPVCVPENHLSTFLANFQYYVSISSPMNLNLGFPSRCDNSLWMMRDMMVNRPLTLWNVLQYMTRGKIKEQILKLRTREGEFLTQDSKELKNIKHLWNIEKFSLLRGQQDVSPADRKQIDNLLQAIEDDRKERQNAQMNLLLLSAYLQRERLQEQDLLQLLKKHAQQTFQNHADLWQITEEPTSTDAKLLDLGERINQGIRHIRDQKQENLSHLIDTNQTLTALLEKYLEEYYKQLHAGIPPIPVTVPVTGTVISSPPPPPPGRQTLEMQIQHSIQTFLDSIPFNQGDERKQLEDFLSKYENIQKQEAFRRDQQQTEQKHRKENEAEILTQLYSHRIPVLPLGARSLLNFDELKVQYALPDEKTNLDYLRALSRNQKANLLFQNEQHRPLQFLNDQHEKWKYIYNMLGGHGLRLVDLPP
jgi:hypothetical protein